MPTMRTGLQALERHAPVPFRALGRVEETAWQTMVDADLLDLAALAGRVCASQHGLPPLVPPASMVPHRWVDIPGEAWRSIPDLSGAEWSALRFAEQCSVDVSAVTGDERAALFDGLGQHAATFTAVLYVLDMVPRALAALAMLADPAVGADPAAGPNPADGPTSGGDDGTSDLWPALDAFTRAVALLDGVDPVTSELVRLRGARQHHCRVCSSRRSRPAVLAGADDDTFTAVDHYRTSHLTGFQQAALALCDAMIWTPGHLDPATVDELVARATEEQRVELVLDITRNALNKVAVALGADAPTVDEGVELFDLDATGNVVAGVSL